MSTKLLFYVHFILFITILLMFTSCSNEGEIEMGDTTLSVTFSTNTQSKTDVNSTSAQARNDTVSSNELVCAVKQMIEEDYYEGVADRVEFDGKNLYIVYNYGRRYANSDLLNGNEESKRFILETDCDDLANYILEMGDEYTNAWETITIDCGQFGTALFDKSMIVNRGYGDFFDYVDGELLK